MKTRFITAARRLCRRICCAKLSPMRAAALLRQVVAGARGVAAVTEVAFSGGEPTLHPQFAEIVSICGSENLKASFVTNGWIFGKFWRERARRGAGLWH